MIMSNSNHNRPILGITMGDPGGIGQDPQVIPAGAARVATTPSSTGGST